MSSVHRILLVVVVASLPVFAGCEWLLLTGAVGGGYVASGEKSTQNLTDKVNSNGAVYVGDAVQTWLNRNQLPMPALPDGSHSFGVRVGSELVRVPGARGARRVDLFDNGAPIASYVVSWDKNPAEYRLVSATNLLYDQPLEVENVPLIPTYSIR
jgi:hypothetical protein